VLEPVANDGLMHRYLLESRFGRFDGYGAEGVARRVHEVEALAILARTPEVGVVVDAVGDRISGSARSVVDVASHPIDTVSGIPRGISHLFRGYAAQARELGEAVGSAAASGSGGAPSVPHAFENTLVRDPTRQQLLDEAAMKVDGVAGRGELYRHAIGLGSDAEATVYVRSALRLATRHAAAPLAAILPGIRMPSGRAVDGTIVVVAAFDAVRWTAEVADAESAARAALPDGTTAPELWLAAPPSERAQAELAAGGWHVRIDADARVDSR
jgi:hypothetical protein